MTDWSVIGSGSFGKIGGGSFTGPSRVLDRWGTAPGLAVGGAILFYGTTDVGADLDLCESLGAEYVRFDLRWDLVEGTEGVDNWTQPDRMFDAADARGLKVLWIVGRTPSWARSGGSSTTYPDSANYSKFGDFCTRAVARYKNRGVLGGSHWWEFWNEPNGSWGASDYTETTGATALTSMIADAAPKMRAEDADVYLVGPGILRGVGGSGWVADTTYLQGMYDAGLAACGLDALGFHPYAQPYSPMGDHADNGWERIAAYRQVAVDAGDPIKVVCTEQGQETSGGSVSVTEAVQAEYVDDQFDRYLLEVAAGRVTGPLFYYAHRDRDSASVNKEDHFGLIKSDRTTWKPGATTYQTRAAALA